MHYPEMWGFVLFEDNAQGELKFEMPADELIKWELRKLYYRQRQFYAEHGTFTDEFAELKGNDVWSIDPHIETTGNMFQVSEQASDGQRWIRIREDGKVWFE